MINIFANKISVKDRDTIKTIFSPAGIKYEDLVIIDLAVDDIDKNSLDGILVCFDSSATRAVVKQLIAHGIIQANMFYGNDLLDRNNKFALFNVPVRLSEVLNSQYNKDIAWAKVQSVATLNTEFIDNSAVISEQIVIDTLNESTNEDLNEDENSFSVLEFMKKLDPIIASINLSEQSVGSSLSKFKVIQFSSGGKVLTIQPTNREKDTPDFITFKDLLVLIKVSNLLGLDHIDFRKESQDG